MEKYDLVVAGAGGGLIGAIKAAQLGCRVLLIDASADFIDSCNTSKTTGMFPAAGSRWQKAEGVIDSPEIFTKDIMAKTKGEADPVATKALTEVSVEVMEWMADSLNIPWELVTDFHYPGHSVDRCLSVKGRKGYLIMRPIWEQVKDGLFDFMPSTRLIDVELADGRVSAAVVIDSEGNQKSIPTNNLLLATNGYGANKELLRKYNPEISEVYYHGSVHSKGEAMAIGEKVGAEMGYLDAYQGHAAIAAHANTLVGWATVMQGGFILNLAGERFGDESSGYSEYAAILNSQPESTGWLIIDKEIHNGSLSFKEYEVTSDSGAIVWSDTLSDLADEIGLTESKLEAAVSHATNVHLGKATDPFGREKFEKPLRAPFAAIKLRPSLFHTQGGLKVTENAEVLSKSGAVIPGLYATGGAAVGISGHGSAGYLAGNGLLAAVGFAYLAAKSVAAKIN